MQSATGLFNLVGRLGASLGTAMVISLMDHRLTTASSELVRYASPYNPTFVQWWRTFEEGFIARGSNPATAARQAMAVLHGIIHQQAAVLAFDHAFATIALISLACLPLLLLFRHGERIQVSVPMAE
jgi:DHA2 family multidrug resistance protein